MSPRDSASIPKNAYEMLGDGTVRIELTRGQYAIVDACDFPKISPIRWSAVRRSFGDGFYAWGCDPASPVERTRIQMHRLILGVYGHIDVDHKDRDGLNNTSTNLRIASRSQNNANRSRPRNNTSGFKGVTRTSRSPKWIAQISVNKKQIYLGCYSSREDAARAYDSAAQFHFGVFARVNFPREGEQQA